MRYLLYGADCPDRFSDRVTLHFADGVKHMDGSIRPNNTPDRIGPLVASIVELCLFMFTYASL